MLIIGLQNLDKTSKEYRAYKQIIERFNRTFKSYYKIQTSFKSFDGALNYIPAFIINYNFIRPHSSINNKAPVNLNFLQNIDKIPDKWIAIIKKGIELN
jgi:transposase InsO family protein